MSRLEELIEKLCPDGVEYRTLQDVAEYRRGSFPQPYTNPQWYGGNNSMPFVQVADMHDDDFLLAEETKQRISEIAQPKSIFVEKGTILVSIQGTIGRVAITQYDCYVDRTIAIFYNIKEHNLDKKFFSYVLKQKFGIEKQYARGSTLKTITKEEFSAFTIPVPPLEVQSEIVRILDNFTELTAELTAELTTELTARKKQYEYYRDELLTFGNELERKTLRDICTIKNGKDYKSFPVGEYPVYGSGGIMTYIDRYAYDKPSVLIPRKGSIDKLYYVDSPFWNVDTIFYTEIYPEVIPKYLYYFLQTQHLENLNTAGGVPSLTQSVLNTVIVPVPPLEKQQRIVDILDRFDKLCNDISEGLPAEIEARQKQYEYYRDKLLTFKEKAI